MQRESRSGRHTRFLKNPQRERPTPEYKFLGPSGAGIWGPVTIDPKRQAVYVSTGNAFSAPDLGRSNAVMAMDINTGKGAVGYARRCMATCGTRAARKGHRPQDTRHGAPIVVRARRRRSEGGRHAAGPTTITVRMRRRIPIGISPPGRSWSTSRMATVARAGRPEVGRRCGRSIRTTKARWSGTRISAEGRFSSVAQRTKSRRYFAMRGTYGGLVAIRLKDGLERWFADIPPQESMAQPSRYQCRRERDSRGCLHRWARRDASRVLCASMAGRSGNTTPRRTSKPSTA